VRLDDQEFVRGQYGSTDRLRTRISVWKPDPERGTPQDFVVAELARRAPSRVLEVGCGTGALASRIALETGGAVVAVDSSPAMVEAARSAGVDAQVGNVEQLAYGDGEFDAAVAAWMLYHVEDLDRGLAELARIVAPGGCLVAVTNGAAALAEVYELVGGAKLDSRFSSENAEELLLRHFDSVRRTDFRPRAVFEDRAALAGYLRSLERPELADRLDDEMRFPFVAHGAVSVFVAEHSP
jgi:SAM-dependent methyltransferase